MDIVIHGTKGGYKKFFSSQKLFGLLDVTADSPNNSAMGQEAYAIRFTVDNTIFSKYRIIRDVGGAKRTGFVGFSLFLQKNESLSGTDIIALLDKVSDEYHRKYISDNNLDEVKENWDFLNNILSDYKSKLKYDEVIPSGSKDDAFIYFKDKDELKRYFDAPFQDEYKDNRQVLFVNVELLNRPENPLNALRHSENNLSGKIDLDNKLYYLNNYDHFKGVTITANGRIRSQERDNNFIRAKWLVTIKYSKDDRCYWPIEAKGTLSNPASEIFKYLEIRDNQIFINYEAFNNPTPIEKTVQFEIKDRRGTPVYDAEIKIGDQFWEMITTGYQFNLSFSGEQLKKHWTVSVKKGAELILLDKSISLEDGISTIGLILYDRKIVKLHVIDDDGLVYDYKLQLRDEKGKFFGNYDGDNIILEFINDEIFKLWNITISHPNHESKTFSYCPDTDENPITIKLNFKHFGRVTLLGNNYEVKRYRLKIDTKYGKRFYKRKEIKDWVSEYPDFGVTSRFGYKFVEWDFHEDQANDYFDGTYEAVILERWWHKNLKLVCITGVIALIALIVGGVFFVKSCRTGAPDKPVTKEIIVNYVEGGEFLLTTLNNYKTNWDSRMPAIKKEGGSWLSILGFGSKDEILDSTDYKRWDEVTQTIDDAIAKRKNIDNKDFEALKNQDFSRQKEFEEVVKKIDPAQYNDFVEKLGDVSSLSLNQIINKIDSIVKTPDTLTNNVSATYSGGRQAPRSGNDGDNSLNRRANPSQSGNLTESNSSVSNSNSNSSAEITPDISVELQGDNINHEKLLEYAEGNFLKFNNSIKLYKEFFDLIENANKNFISFNRLLNNVKKDSFLKNSVLKDFLETICKDSKTFEELYSKKIEKIAKQDRKILSISELKRKLE